MKKINNIKEVEKYDTNPFVIELKGKMFLRPRVNTIIAKGESIVNTETGEVVKDNTLLGRRKMVDKSEFAKIYASEIGVLYSLSKSAINVFLHFIKIMDYDNKVLFNYNTEYAKVGYTNYVSVYNGILELLNEKIIACSNYSNIYWINPTIVCKGERFAIYTEYVCNESWTAKYAQMAKEKEQGREYYENMEDIKYKMDLAKKPTNEEIVNYNEKFKKEKPVTYTYKVINERQPKQLNIEGGTDPFPQD